MKLVKKMMMLGVAAMLVVGMSAVSYAQIPLNIMITTAAPISMLENTYELRLQGAVLKHTAQTARALSIPQQQTIEAQEEYFFYPDDTLYLPLINTQTGKAYAQKSRPSNWSFYTYGIDSEAISNVRWATETGTLTVAIDFAASLPQSEVISCVSSITLCDDQNDCRSVLTIPFRFGNVTKEIVPGVVNEISSPMNLKAGELYNGEAVTLSFGNNVIFKNAVLPEGQTIYLNLDRSFDSEIANRYKSFDIQCYNFMGDEDTFEEPGRVCLPAQKGDSYVYEVVDGSLKRIQSEYDEENSLVCFTSDKLGYYIVSPVLMTEAM